MKISSISVDAPNRFTNHPNWLTFGICVASIVAGVMDFGLFIQLILWIELATIQYNMFFCDGQEYMAKKIQDAFTLRTLETFAKECQKDVQQIKKESEKRAKHAKKMREWRAKKKAKIISAWTRVLLWGWDYTKEDKITGILIKDYNPELDESCMAKYNSPIYGSLVWTWSHCQKHEDKI